MKPNMYIRYVTIKKNNGYKYVFNYFLLLITYLLTIISFLLIIIK